MFQGRHGEFVFVCGTPKCGRSLVSTIHEDEVNDWLVACHVGEQVEVVRCPRHITHWSCRTAAIAWTRSVREWAKQAQERDLKRYPVAPPSWLDPVPLPAGVVGGFIRIPIGGER